MDNQPRIEDKAEFVKTLCALLKTTRAFSDLESITYHKDGGAAYIDVSFRLCTKRINVTANTCYGILYNFVRCIDNAPYVLNDEVM